MDRRARRHRARSRGALARGEGKLMRAALAIVVVLLGAVAGPADANPRDLIKKRIRALRAATLTDELALDEATAAKLFPVLAKWDAVADQLLRERADLVQKLAAVDTVKDAKAIDKLV